MVTFYQLALILFIALGSLTYGFSSSIIATTLNQPTFLVYFDLNTRHDANDIIGAINAMFYVGGLFGCISVLWLPDKHGRKLAILISSITCVVGGALQAGSVHIGMFLVARFVTGIGIGQMLPLVPLYQSEVSPTNLRGFLVGMHGVLLCFGYSIASWTGVAFYFVPNTNKQWRGPLAVQTLWPLLLACGVWFVPESPRWLITKNRHDEARLAFQKVHNSGSHKDDEAYRNAVDAEFRLLSVQAEKEMREVVPVKAFFTRPNLLKRCLVGFGVMFMGQGTATIVIGNYGPILYKGLGFDTLQTFLIQAGWISVCPWGNIFNSYVVDRFGRTRLLMFGWASTVVALVGAAVTVVIYEKTGSRSAASAAVFFLFLHIAGYCVSIDATSYIYACEIFPTPLRARGIGISVSGLFCATIIFLQAAPTAFSNIGGYYYVVFAVITTCSFFITWFYFPETNGKSLEDIAEVFGDDVTLDNAADEALHQRVRQAHYNEAQLVDSIEEAFEHQDSHVTKME